MDVQNHPVRPRRNWLNADRALHAVSFGAVLLVFGMLISLVAVLLIGAMPSIKTFGLNFLTTSAWRATPTVARDPVTSKPLRDANHRFIKLPGNTYGALAVIYGTAMTSMIAMALAIPPSFAGGDVSGAVGAAISGRAGFISDRVSGCHPQPGHMGCGACSSFGRSCGIMLSRYW